MIETKTIEQVTETLIDYRGKTPEKTRSGVVLITAKVIKDGRILDENHEYISEAKYDSWMRRGLPKLRDILITTEAPLGEVAQLKKTKKVALAQRVILLRGNPQMIDQDFYFHALRSPFVKGELRKRATGTTVLGIKQSELRKVRIPYFPPPIQSRIAAILSAYDDLIENNTRRIQVLEEMARRIYEEWFVRFRFPGHEKAGMIKSELGLIPDGWEVDTVANAVKRFPAGKKYDQKTVKPSGKVPVLDQGRSGIIGFHDDEPSTSASLDNPVIVFANHTCYQRLIFFPFSAIQNVIPFKSSDKHPRNIFWLHYATKNLVTFNDYKGHFPQFAAKQILIPKDTLADRFGLLIKPFLSEIYCLNRKNEHLRRMRDLLLPKLISGEIDVSNFPESD
jgi:type I restriction enzyme, S subunit